MLKNNLMLEKISSKLDIHTYDVLIKSSKTMIVKVIGILSGFGISVVLGRTLGSEGLGVINLANKFGMILLIFTSLGFHNVIIKFISIGKEHKSEQKIVDTVKSALILNGLFSVLISGIGTLLLPLILDFFFHSQDLYIPLLIAFLTIIPQTLSRVFSAALNGYGKIWQSNLVEQTLSSVLVLIGIGLFFVLNIELNPKNVLLMYAFSRIILAFLTKAIWDNSFKSKFKGNLNFKPMLKMGLPLLLVGGTTVIASNMDSLMLGSMASISDVGMYTVAAKIALITSFFLQVTNAAIAPKIAHLFQQNKIYELNVLVKSVTKGLFIISVLFSLFFLFFGGNILNLWGVEFKEAYWLLLVLSLGQFFNISTGCSGYLLLMSGHEKIHGYLSTSSVIINFILNYFFILYCGAMGAAIATAITVSIENLVKVILAKKYTGISTI